MATQFLFIWSAFFCLAKADYPVVVLPDPHLVILSPVDVDSTSLTNVLLGGDPNCQNCLTNVSPNDTKTPCSPKYAVGDWAETTIKVSLFQASCFGEPGGYERVKNTVDVVKNFVRTNNRFLIVLNSSIHKTQDSFDTNLDHVLSQFGALFGREFWSRTVLGATNWHFDIDSVVARNQTGENEEWWTEMMSNTIKQRFGVTGNISAVFIDADAKLPSNIDDPLQTNAFQIETAKLLSLMRNTITMEMRTLQEQTDELNNIINNTMTEMQAQLDQLTTDMVEVQDEVIDNGIDISNVIGAVALIRIENEEQETHINEINRNITEVKGAVAFNQIENEKQEKHINEINRNITEIDCAVAFNQIENEKQFTEINGNITEVKDAVAFNQIENEKHFNEINGNITEINHSLKEDNFITGLLQSQGFECSGDQVITIPGNIVSANYPGNYPSMNNEGGGIFCSFILVPQPGLSVNLQFEYFKIYANNNDYLEITPFGGSTSKYYQTNVPPTTTYAVDQSVTVLFKSYNPMHDYVDHYKFKAMFSMV